MVSDQAQEIINSFSRYIKTGDKGHIADYTIEELELALNETGKYRSDRQYPVIERRYQELQQEKMLRMQFEYEIPLEQEQKDLFVTIAEASRNVPRQKRQKLMLNLSFQESGLIHPALPNGKIDAYEGDIDTLSNVGLLNVSYGSRGTEMFDVSPAGFRYYEKLKQYSGQPTQRIVKTMNDYLKGESFQQKYPEAYKKWQAAEELLWSSDSEQQLTTIGHHCREAMQYFATELTKYSNLGNVENDPSKTLNKIRAVLNKESKKLSKMEKPFLEALISYWGTVNDLIQRQEHGAQKKSGTLVWEDGRRAVFQTAVVMYEIDSSLS